MIFFIEIVFIYNTSRTLHLTRIDIYRGGKRIGISGKNGKTIYLKPDLGFDIDFDVQCHLKRTTKMYLETSDFDLGNRKTRESYI